MDNDQFIGIVATIKIKDGRDDEYVHLLLELITDHSTREPDCIDIIVHRDVDDPTRILLYERWRIPHDRFVPEQMSKSFIKDFTDRTREMVEDDDLVTYWNATDLVARGERTQLAGSAAHAALASSPAT